MSPLGLLSISHLHVRDKNSLQHVTRTFSQLLPVIYDGTRGTDLCYTEVLSTTCTSYQAVNFRRSPQGHRIAGNFRGVQNFTFFEGREVNAEVFHMQSYWWVWFPGTEPRILEPMKISAEGSGAK